MNRVKKLIKEWESNSIPTPTVKVLRINLGAHDYARLCALREVYAGRTEEQIVSDLMSTILDEVEETLRYVQGSKFISQVEKGSSMPDDLECTELFEMFNPKYQHVFDEK